MSCPSRCVYLRWPFPATTAIHNHMPLCRGSFGVPAMPTGRFIGAESDGLGDALPAGRLSSPAGRRQLVRVRAQSLQHPCPHDRLRPGRRPVAKRTCVDGFVKSHVRLIEDDHFAKATD